MVFKDFLDLIESPDLRAVATAWDDAREAQLMPVWSDLRPSAIARQLKILWCYSYLPETDEFVGKLGGDIITQILGQNIKGVSLSKLKSKINVENAIRRSRRVMSEPALFHGRGRIIVHDGTQGFGERIIMPLAGDTGLGCSILGATEYKPDNLKTPEPTAETEDWVALSCKRPG